MRKRGKHFLAGLLAFAMTATNLPVMHPQAAVNTNALQLKLSFEDNLTDTSVKSVPVTANNGAVTYTDGIKGKAALFNGSTSLSLGTGEELSPEKLTLSFWIKPPADGLGDDEQIITWSKKQWYTDGWYLGTKKDAPLEFSVGPADTNKQPYMLAVSGERDTFFPPNTWTHIAVTYDSDSKTGAIYRNGIKQALNTKYPVGNNGATGIIGPASDTEKTIGYNGTAYNGAYLSNVALDEYALYNEVHDQTGIIDLYDESAPEKFDRKAVAQSDLYAINLPASTRKNLTLPLTGAQGSEISWSSDNKGILAEDGTVTPPDQETTVTLTASVKFAGSEAVTDTFEIKVLPRSAEGEEEIDRITDIDIGKIVLEDAYLQNAAQKENEYLLSLDAEKFLYHFYRISGLTPKTESGYDGWEREQVENFRGHMFGHYMSGLSQAYHGSADPNTKAALLTEIKEAVNGLKACQEAYAGTHPDGAGWIAPFPEATVQRVGEITETTSYEKVMVPWYNLHKVLAGLIDVYTFVKDDTDNIGDTALEVAEAFGEYIYRYTTKVNKDKLLSIEYGGMNEALYELYDLTGNANIKTAAEGFDETSLFRDLAAGKDVLSGKHANTTVPKLIGALKRYTVMMNNEEYKETLTPTEQQELTDLYLKAAENFWDIVIEHHTYVTGGNSQSEHFHDADKLYYDAVERGDGPGAVTCETCNTYNMLKLSRALYQVTKDKKYMDYYENTYTNAILSSQNPETGTTMYFQPMAPGYSKIFNRPYDEFWCCTGTGVENFSKLGDTMYFVEKENVYVNMYYSNTYEYDRQNLKLEMTSNLPNSEEITVTISDTDKGAVKEGTNLRFRIPDWVAAPGASIAVNGKQVELSYPEDAQGYAQISNIKGGDKITLTFPMEVKAYATQDNQNFIAFKYGPVVLSAGLGTNDIEAYDPNGIMVRQARKDTSCQTSIIVNTDTIEEWLDNLAQNMERVDENDTLTKGTVEFKLNNTDSPDLRYTPHFMRYQERYGLYMNFEIKDSEEAQANIKRKKERLRTSEVTIDSLDSFDENNSEAAKNKQASDTSSVGSYNGRTFRHVPSGLEGWFSYDLKVNTSAEQNYLECTYTTADKGRKFDIYFNDEFFKTVTVTDAAGSNVFYQEIDEIPETYWKNPTRFQVDTAGNEALDENGNKIPVVTVKFQTNQEAKSAIGGLYGIAIRSSKDYSTKAELSSLSFDTGDLMPEFTPSKKAYTVVVPKATEKVTMSISPNVPSGLIYVNDILIDDAQPREILLAKEQTVLELKAYAQDHATATAYSICIIKSDEPISEEEIQKMNAVNEVVAAIHALGTITHSVECKVKLDELQTAYQALSEEQKKLVSNYDKLEAAFQKYERLTPTKIAAFTFDDTETGFTSEGAKAVSSGAVTLSQDAKAGSALSLSGGTNYLTVTDLEGNALLNDYSELTISYWGKVNNTNANWAFYAAPNANAPSSNNEIYLGILDKGTTVTAERYHNTGSRPTNPQAADTKQNEWRYITVVCDAKSTSVYVNGELKSKVESSYALEDILGENGIFYIGKAPWGNGEFYNGLIDEMSVYNYALTEEEAKKLYNGEAIDSPDQKAANEVSALIAAIGTVSYTESCKEKIDRALKVYAALTDAQKALLAESDKEILSAAESAYQRLEQEALAQKDQQAADKVIGLIDAIGTVSYTTECKEKIDAAQIAYSELTDAQKELVTNSGKLLAANLTYKQLEQESKDQDRTQQEAQKNKEAADKVIALIQAIGTVVYTADCEARITAAQTAYEALTAAQKALVTNASILTTALADYQKLKEQENPTTLTSESFMENNPGLPSGSQEESKNSTFVALQAKVSSSAKTSQTITWKKVKDADGYVVFGNKCGKKYKYQVLTILQKNTKISYKHTKLTKGTYYKYIVQAYKMVDGKVQILATSKSIYAATTGAKYANVSSLKMNKTKLTLKVGKKFTLKAIENKKGKQLKRFRKVAFESSNSKIVSVSKTGQIKAKKKGTCYIYAYAQNGVCKKIKVTVKKK